MRKCLSVWLLSLFVTATAIAQSASESLYLQTSEVNDIMVRYSADYNSLRRFYTPATGINWWERNNAGGFRSAELRNRQKELVQQYLTELGKMDFDKMNVNGKVDYLLFRRNLNSEAYELQQEDGLYVEISPLFPFEDKIMTIEKPRRRGLAVNGQQVAQQLEQVRMDIEASLKKFAKTGDSLTKKQSEFAAKQAGGLQDELKYYYNFYNGYDPLFTWWVPVTYKQVDSLLGLYKKALTLKRKQNAFTKDDGSGIIGNPIGREELIRQLKNEFIPYTPEELIAIANKEFAWCDAELLKASKDMGFGDNWKAAQEKVKNSYVEPGKQPEAMYDLYKQSVDFLKKNDLLTIPPLAEEDWSMFMMSPEAQKVNPFFLGGESLIVSYPTNTMDYGDKMMSMRGNNPHFSRATVHHELIAGHHLQGFMNGRYKAYRNFDTPFWVEGNALYWELLLWDLKFPRSPEDRIGMLFWRMHRCARIIFSLNYHLGNWTPQQCIDFLVDRVGHERANAEGEVRRSFTGNYGPLYQIAYMLGGLQFMALKRELVDGGKMTYKQYHDAILHENSMPIEMLRAILTKQNLKRDFQTNWKFYKF